MGFESFHVELRGGPATPHQIDQTIRRLPNVRSDPQSLPTKGSTYYLVDDSRHVIELELLGARVSCRFTLCHPPSIDAAFLAFVEDLMRRLQMEVRICDDVRPEHADTFAIATFAEFSAAALGAIAARRKEWIAAFGKEQFAASTPEVHQRLILPKCQPIVSHSRANQER